MQSVRVRLRFLAELVSVLLFVAMFAAFLLQVFTRYVLNDPVAWTQEFVLITYIWIIFWCGAFLLREREHITFDMIFMSLPPKRRRWLAVALTILIGAAFVAAIPGTFDYVSFMKIEKSPVIGIRFDFLYSIFVIFTVAVVVGAMIRVWRLLRHSWEDELKHEGEIEP
jgi:TRAP-type C4-dicarboxylate transport system permease small subunit